MCSVSTECTVYTGLSTKSGAIPADQIKYKQPTSHRISLDLAMKVDDLTMIAELLAANYYPYKWDDDLLIEVSRMKLQEPT